MTTEEIIKGLESVKTECGRHLDEGFAWICKPIDEAIEVLKREPCTDAVSREAVIGLYENYRPSLATHVTEFGDALKALHTVTPERPKGEWVKYSIPRCGEQHYKCSHCDEYVNFGLYGDFYTKDFIYCPHCGADMRG